MNNIKERDFSIDILKFLAVFFIINSHMDTLYTNYKMLATGGSIGDTLFLFCSGYTLLLNKNSMRFDNWYKKNNQDIPFCHSVRVDGGIVFNATGHTYYYAWRW